MSFRVLFMAALILSAAIFAFGQKPGVKKSQFATVSQRIAGTTVTVEYSRPVARGRKLFGPDGIVKYGKMWMPGANKASFIKFSSDVTVNGKYLKAGSYSFWIIPGDKKWLVMLSTDWDQWHTAYPGESKDAARFEVEPVEGSHMETLAYYFPVVGPDGATLRLHWGKTIIPMTIKLAS